jgi:hypothetical protein
VRKAARSVAKVAQKIVRCVWKTVKTWANCAVSVIPSFKDCWQNIVKGVKGGMMDLISDCNSVNDCLKKLMKGPQKLLDKVGAEAKKVLTGVGGEVMKQVNNIAKLPDQADKVFKEVSSKLKTITGTMSKAVKGGIGALKSLDFSMCTGKGGGLWYFEPSDCGAFKEVEKIFKLKSVSGVPNIFKNILVKFAKCAAMRNIFPGLPSPVGFGLPTPFLQIKLMTWCIPSFLQVPLKGLIGSLQYLFGLIGSGKKMHRLFTALRSCRWHADYRQKVPTAVQPIRIYRTIH